MYRSLQTSRPVLSSGDALALMIRSEEDSMGMPVVKMGKTALCNTFMSSGLNEFQSRADARMLI
jgi:hypothetical protein